MTALWRTVTPQWSTVTVQKSTVAPKWSNVTPQWSTVTTKNIAKLPWSTVTPLEHCDTTVGHVRTQLSLFTAQCRTVTPQ